MYRFSVWSLTFIIIGVFLLPFVYTDSPFELNSQLILKPPSFEHIFGTDRLGRDIFARILDGGQT